jgi:hypothetical protein
LAVSESASKSQPCIATATAPTRHFEHVVVIVLENEDYDAAKTCFDGLVSQYGGRAFDNFHGLFHHSYPNYLAMVGGQQFPELCTLYSDHEVVLPDDDRHRSIADRLTENGLTWRDYAEGYSCDCRYASRHVPFLSFASTMKRDPQNVVDAADPNRGFLHDAAGPSFPSYAFYSPNLDNDGHDTCITFACNWVKEFLAGVPPERWNDSLVIVTFDEASGSDAANNQIATVFLGPLVTNGRVAEHYNHYNVLRTIEDNFGLAPLADGDCKAVPITGIWKNDHP